jgi:hypothetical protein
LPRATGTRTVGPSRGRSLPWHSTRSGSSRCSDLAGRKAHVEGGGGDIFRDVERMNDILAEPAHVHKVDVLLSKQVFTA